MFLLLSLILIILTANHHRPPCISENRTHPCLAWHGPPHGLACAVASRGETQGLSTAAFRLGVGGGGPGEPEKQGKEMYQKVNFIMSI